MSDIFAEIEMDGHDAHNNAVGAAKDVPIGAQKIEDNCPARKMFYEMRALAPDNPHEWNGARLFYRQGKFMENFVDDYAKSMEFSMHTPCYQRMGYERLRTYFSWRSLFRATGANGVVGGVFPSPPRGLSYIFLYIYELLLCIGEKTPADALARLYALRDAYAEEFPALEKSMQPWLKDFHVYYGVENAEPTNVALRRSEFIFSESCGLLAWNEISAYNVTKSKFYTENAANAALLENAFAAALSGIADFCRTKNVVLRDLFMLTGRQGIPWTPFRGALFYPWLRQPDRTVELPGGEVYICQNNEWTTLHHTPYAHNKDLAAFFIKKTESLVRESCGFAKLTVDTNALAKSRGSLSSIGSDISLSGGKNRGISTEELEAVITRAVAAFFQEKNRVVINVDVSNLTRIREEADGITEKLVVDEEKKPHANDRPQTKHEIQPQAESEARPLPEPASFFTSTPPSENEKSPAFNFTSTEIDALKIITASDGDISKIKAFADSKGIMLEVLVDGINEKAMDAIGDNLLDFSDTLTVYEEYSIYCDG